MVLCVCVSVDRILLKIKIPDVDVKDTKMDITKDKFSFSYKGGGKEYHFEFMFRFPVNASTVKYRSTQRDLALVIEKETSNSYWPHLMVCIYLHEGADSNASSMWLHPTAQNRQEKVQS